MKMVIYTAYRPPDASNHEESFDDSPKILEEVLNNTDGNRRLHFA